MTDRKPNIIWSGGLPSPDDLAPALIVRASTGRELGVKNELEVMGEVFYEPARRGGTKEERCWHDRPMNPHAYDSDSGCWVARISGDERRVKYDSLKDAYIGLHRDIEKRIESLCEARREMDRLLKELVSEVPKKQA